MPDLSLLVTFLAVYRLGSFTTAARTLGMAQPTVTTQIRALERDLDRQLFVRSAGGSAPTSAADVLAGRIGRHVDALTDAVSAATTPVDPFTRPVQLGGPAELIERRVLPSLAALHERGLRLRVTTGLAGELLEGLRQGRYDLTVSTIRPRGRGLATTPLTDEELLLLGAPRFAGPHPTAWSRWHCSPTTRSCHWSVATGRPLSVGFPLPNPFWSSPTYERSRPRASPERGSPSCRGTSSPSTCTPVNWSTSIARATG